MVCFSKVFWVCSGYSLLPSSLCWGEAYLWLFVFVCLLICLGRAAVWRTAYCGNIRPFLFDIAFRNGIERCCERTTLVCVLDNLGTCAVLGCALGAVQEGQVSIASNDSCRPLVLLQNAAPQ